MGYAGVQGTASVDVEDFSESIDENSLESSQEENLTIGTKDNPVPLRYKMDPIYESLDVKYWSEEDQSQVPDLEEKQGFMKQAYERYGEIYGVDLTGEVVWRISFLSLSVNSYY